MLLNWFSLSFCFWCNVDYILEDIFTNRRSAEPLTLRRTPAGLASLYEAVSGFILGFQLLLLSGWLGTVWALIACQHLALLPSIILIFLVCPGIE